MSVCSRSNWNLEMLVFWERGKLEYLEKNLLEQRREPTINSSHMVSMPRFQHGPQRWGGGGGRGAGESALTTAGPLLRKYSLELMSMDAATLYFHLLRSICTVTLRLKIFTHGFYI